MANSLLAHLYSKIKGSQEDVATIALQYLLSQSKILNEVFTKQIASRLGVELDKNLLYACQSVGENNERPDMVGKDKSGCEAVLCEMKFYAGLTHNQPLSYLKRLRDENGKGLVFICPRARQTTLWAKLKSLCNEYQSETISPFCISVDGIRMAILTWAEILAELDKAAFSFDKEYISDIHQLKGYCDQMDSDAFIPFAPEELSAETAKRAQRYYNVIDEIINLILADENLKASIKGNRFFNYAVYERDLHIDEFVVSIGYDCNYWKSSSSVETPFWVAFTDLENEQGESFQKCLLKIDEEKKENLGGGICYLALEPLTNATFDEVCVNLKEQILQYLDLFHCI